MILTMRRIKRILGIMKKTTNHLDGGVFSQLKKLIKLHQGLAKKRKVKLIDEFLSQHNEKL